MLAIFLYYLSTSDSTIGSWLIKLPKRLILLIAAERWLILPDFEHQPSDSEHLAIASGTQPSNTTRPDIGTPARMPSTGLQDDSPVPTAYRGSQLKLAWSSGAIAAQRTTQPDPLTLTQ